MKKYFFFAAAAIVAASCAKTPAPVQTPDGPEAPAVEGKVAVQFGTNVKLPVETKSNGHVSQWSAQDLYVYGLQRIKPAGVVKNLYKTPFISNVMAKAPEKNTPAVTSGAINVYATGTEPFYYVGTNTYDFFGYYVDDAASPITPVLSKVTQNAVTDSAYVLPILINGGQDIMLAKADTAYAARKAFGENLERKPAGWKSGYAFSAYAARREVHPILQFEHQLAQLVFKVESGTDFSTSPQLYVDKVAVNKVNTKANLYIASVEIPQGLYDFEAASGDDMNKDVLWVKQAPTSEQTGLQELQKVAVPSKNADPKAIAIGEPLMLFPEASYEIALTLSQAGVTQDVEPLVRTINIADVKVLIQDPSGKNPGDPDYTPTYDATSQSKFEAGYSYVITIKVYGLESVDITAELAPWKEGGKIDIDTDEAPEF